MSFDFSNFVVAFQAVVPMFCLMFIGVLIKVFDLLNAAELKRVNRMVFRVFFSIMMFYNLYTSNFVLIGLPLIVNLFGDNEIAVTTMMVAIVVPIYNVLGVITLEIFRGGRVNLPHLLFDVLKNPMILGALVGAAFFALGIPVPKPVLRPLAQITAATTPIALIILGASFRLGSTKEHKKQLAACVLARLVLVPGVVLGAAAQMGFRGMEFATLISIFATPCAVAGFVMAQQMDSDADLAGNCVVFTSALSCVTIFFWIVLFKELGIL